MSNGVWPVHVINLADNTARMENARRQLEAQGLDFERIEAVNGWQLPEAQIAKVYDEEANRTGYKQALIPAEIGCYLSHVSCWQKIASGKTAGGIVLEDDFAAAPDFGDVVDALTKDGSPQWDMVKLFSINEEPDLLTSSPLLRRYDLVRPFRVPSTTLGYAITKKAAQRLLERYATFFRPIDEDHKFFWEHGLDIAVVIPSPLTVGEQKAETGTIGDARRKSLKAGSWRKLKYQLGYQVRLRWHRWRDGK